VETRALTDSVREGPQPRTVAESRSVRMGTITDQEQPRNRPDRQRRGAAQAPEESGWRGRRCLRGGIILSSHTLDSKTAAAPTATSKEDEHRRAQVGLDEKLKAR
jgi:hypothetical protein